MALLPTKNSRPESTGEAVRQLAPLMNMGFELAATVGAFGLIGWYIDDYAGTKPIWFVALMIFGLVGGMIKFFRTVMRYSAQNKPKKL